MFVATVCRVSATVTEERSGPGTPISATAPAVAVKHLGKHFRLPHEQYHTLKERALHPFRSRSFDTLQAVDDVSVEIAPGEFFGIVGRNGSGKSTLLKCLAGIYAVDEGELSINGRLSPFIELGVGFNPDLTARDNVIINAIMLGLSRKEARERFDDIIAFAELEEFLDLKLKNYSSGMYVRLAFATAVQVNADILLIDEVLAVGDAAFQQKCFDEFTRLREAARCCSSRTTWGPSSASATARCCSSAGASSTSASPRRSRASTTRSTSSASARRRPRTRRTRRERTRTMSRRSSARGLNRRRARSSPRSIRASSA
jgi:ABC-type polysaccharide/polyol phosphate transport system ATPase subunit